MSEAACKRRRVAQDMTAFAALIASPIGLGNVILPANAYIAISPAHDVLSGNLQLRVNDGSANQRYLVTPNLLADQIYRLGWIERGRKLTINAAIDVKVYVLDEWRRPYQIAQYID